MGKRTLKDLEAFRIKNKKRLERRKDIGIIDEIEENTDVDNQITADRPVENEYYLNFEEMAAYHQQNEEE